MHNYRLQPAGVMKCIGPYAGPVRNTHSGHDNNLAMRSLEQDIGRRENDGQITSAAYIIARTEGAALDRGDISRLMQLVTTG